MRSLPTCLAALALVLVPVPAAGAAGTYVVRSCDNGSLSGWEPTARYVPATSTCHRGGGALEAEVAGAPGEATIWHFQAPADTEIAGFSIARDDWLNASVPYGSPVYALQTFGAGSRYARVRANLMPFAIAEPFGVEAASGLTGQTSIELSVNCGGGGACRVPAASARLYAAHIVLRDASDPRIETVGGSLLDAGPVSGLRALRYSASDRGGGVQRAELLVDGVLAQGQTVDANGGACAPAGGEYALVVPCKPQASSAFALDTRALREGLHDVTLRVYDATGANRAVWNGSIVVDNVPPPVNRVRPSIAPGAPRVGAVLTASPGEWSAPAPAFGYRWQRYDSSWEDVAGSTGATYVPRGPDAGHRLRVRITAVSAEGSAAAYSEATDPVAPAAAEPAGSPSSAVPSPAAPSAVPPAAPSRRVRAWIVRGRRHAPAATVRWGGPVTVAGTVADAGGRPAGGELVTLLGRSGRGAAHPVAVARAAADGRFAVHLGAGPSRRLVATAGAGRSASVVLRVRASVSLRTARHGRWVALSGGLRGGHVPRSGVLVTVQGLRAHRWVALTTVRATAAGRFRARVPAGAAGRLRAAVPVQPGYPFAAGASPARSSA